MLDEPRTILEELSRYTRGPVKIQARVVYHLHKVSGISKWIVNGKRIFGRPNQKITKINGFLKKVDLFDQLERSNRFLSFHLHFFRVLC